MVDLVWFYDLLQHLTDRPAFYSCPTIYYCTKPRLVPVRAEERVNVDKWSCLAAN